MKAICKYVLPLVAVLFLTNSCDDEDFHDMFDSSWVENHNSHRLSCFKLPQTIAGSIVDSVEVIQINGSYVNKFNANIEVEDGLTSVTQITIPNNTNIPNGDYVIKFYTISNRFIAQIDAERIAIKEINNGNYEEIKTLGSDGTKNSPFELNTNNDFSKFIKALSEDTYHGAGFYFKQTGFISWSNDEATTGEGLSSQIFAGVYDGGNNILSKVNINGKSNCGMFTTLTNGAVVKSLVLNNISISNGSTMGTIAGMAEYTTTISDIKTSGEVSGSDNVGGLVGSASGNITISNCEIGTSVSGKNNIGGVIGYVHDNCQVSVSKHSIGASFRVGSENAQELNDAVNVGGVIGLLDNSSFNVTNSELIHTSALGDNAIVVSAGSRAGGVVGKINCLSGNSSILNTRVILPNKIDNYGGGFVGQATISHELRISGCQFGGIFKQGNYIGGAIGALEATADNLFVYDSNDIVASDNSDINVSGSNYVGALCGWLKAKKVTLSGSNYFMVPVSGKECVGGLVGYMEGTTLNIGTPLYGKSNTETSGIIIDGTTKVGGAVGYMRSSTLKSTQTLYPTSGIPQFDENNVKIICTIKGNGNYVGGAVGHAWQSIVEGISVKATITNTDGIYTGGIVGYFDDGNLAVKYCSVSGIITAGNYTGGIVGEINKLGQITQCINYGKITASEYTGGIVGKILNKEDEPWVNECVNVGSVSGKQMVGGIVGYISADGNEAIDWTKIARSGNYGAITASSSSSGCVGGIVGKCDSDKVRVNDCANHGTITGNGTFKGIGGIAGSLGKDGVLNELDNVDVYYCANTGKIISDKSGEAHMGGIVGYLEEGDEGDDDTNSQVHLCYNCGEVGPAKEATHGGMIGHCDYYTSLRYCINYGNTGENGEAMIGTVVTAGIVHDTGLYHLEGTGDDDGRNWSSISFTEAQMNSLSTFSGFSSSDWVVGKQLNMQGSGESSKSRVILNSCPFQNIVY